MNSASPLSSAFFSISTSSVEISQRNLSGDRLEIEIYVLDSVGFRFLWSALVSARFWQAEGVSRFIICSVCST